MAETRDAGVVALTCHSGEDTYAFADAADPTVVVVHGGLVDDLEIIDRHPHDVSDAANAVGELLRPDTELFFQHAFRRL